MEKSSGFLNKKGEKPTKGNLLKFDHATFLVGNAKQAADWYCVRFGFKHVLYKGLENGERNIASHVIKLNDIYFVFKSALNPNDIPVSLQLQKHGDHVTDISFAVTDLEAVVEHAVKGGAQLEREIFEEKDENGTVKMATLRTFGDVTHTLIDRTQYKGGFLPGYMSHYLNDPLEAVLPDTGLLFIDHLVGNQLEEQMIPVTEWYEKVLGFHRFWSVDDAIIQTNLSSMKSIVISNYDETIKMPIIEPSIGKKKSQIQEFCDYNDGPGIQHIALYTDDIIKSVENLKARGIEFLKTPSTYYSQLKTKLQSSKITVTEDIDKLHKLNILIDYDENGYLLQIFTRPCQDRPTLFFEIIQRHNHTGFGAGNIKALFEAIQAEQAERNNL